jgi:2-keto-4-pentenoate hydratase/2-oxohepta-3-ene-1,7-dioic acid hydratase in catechol pathway
MSTPVQSAERPRWCRFEYQDAPALGLVYQDDVLPLLAALDAEAHALGLHPNIRPEDLNPVDLDSPDPELIRRTWLWFADQPLRRHTLSLPLDQVRFLVPIPRPGKILALAGNYAKHVIERGGSLAEREETFPYVFMKPATTLANPGDPIVIPAISPDQIDWECELAVVIGRRGKAIPPESALDFVAGYTICNDVSDRKFRPNPNRKPRERDAHFDWLHGKWHDTFCPMGPAVLMADPNLDPSSFHLTLDVSGERMQDASTSQMIFPVEHVIAFISSFMTLEPGDVIATGTPSGVGSARGRFLRPGDTVAASISGIGTLANPVIASPRENC